MGKKSAYKNVLTLISVLSVLLAFTLVCALCLFVLYKTGVADFAFGPPGEVQGGAPAGTHFSLPVHTAASPTANAALTGANFDRILAETPFVDSYYIKIQVSSDETAGDDVPVSGTYEIWRYGDRYKINRYNSGNETEKIITCDGTRIQVIDFLAPSIAYYAVSDGYTFEKLAPLPDFRLLLEEEHEIFEYREKDGACTAAYEYTSLAMVDNVRFSMSTGLIESFSRYRGGRLIWTTDVLSTDLDFSFRDYMFSID